MKKLINTKRSYTLDTPVKILMFWCTKKYKNASAKIKQKIMKSGRSQFEPLTV